MDLKLLRTFVEVASCGSFLAAAKSLHITQSAVSLRVQRLERELGRPLFRRSKRGIELSPAGREFEAYSLNLIRTWEEARQQVALPEGFTSHLSIGAQYSLWPRIAFDWLAALRARLPHLALRAELGMPDRITRLMTEGLVDAALMYAPQMRPGLTGRKLFDEDLILVAGWKDPKPDVGDRYVLIDWGSEFIQAHALDFPRSRQSGITLSLGVLGAEYLIQNRLAGYFPRHAIADHLKSGALTRVPQAQTFSLPVWLIWREDLAQPIRRAAFEELKTIIAASD